ncbi:expressed unknown protein [Seminavis robusta]|uniref:Uncharacterized protein n=1 Tax=Seminavis robusta TaxID=568900 RepID=A0A9N8F2D4_9STRA|nr:expressed unknown protein [Seminavis robusta]|eukprot:Sro3745_g350800.1 n/a (178) ;mRNA; f:1293-1826
MRQHSELRSSAPTKRVSFGDSKEFNYNTTRTEDERRASWYSNQQFVEMRGQAYGLAKTAVLLGEFERLNGNTLRGLEKIIPNKATNPKRRRNTIRSIVELHQMEVNPPATGKAEGIKATLEKYVQKHVVAALKRARDRALEDEREANKIYYEGTNESFKNVALQESLKAIPSRSPAA